MLKNRFFSKKNFLILRLKHYANQIIFEGVSLTLILSFLAVILIFNIISTINRGKFNYDTYLYEKESLTELEKKNAGLNDDYKYYSSDEFRELALRNGFGYAQSNESLFRTKEPITYYISDSKEYLDLKAKDSYLDWWLNLINI